MLVSMDWQILTIDVSLQHRYRTKDTVNDIYRIMETYTLPKYFLSTHS